MLDCDAELLSAAYKGRCARVRSQLKTRGNTIEIREPIRIVTSESGISGYVLMTMECICYLGNNILCDRLPRVTEDSPSGIYY